MLKANQTAGITNDFKMDIINKRQPRPQGFSLKKWVGWEKALASAGHVSPRTP